MTLSTVILGLNVVTLILQCVVLLCNVRTLRTIRTTRERVDAMMQDQRRAEALMRNHRGNHA